MQVNIWITGGDERYKHVTIRGFADSCQTDDLAAAVDGAKKALTGANATFVRQEPNVSTDMDFKHSREYATVTTRFTIDTSDNSGEVVKPMSEDTLDGLAYGLAEPPRS